MRRFVIRWLVNALVLLGVSQSLVGFKLTGFGAALAAVAAITVANLLLQPIAGLIKSAGCLVNVVTLGLFGALVSFVFYVLAFEVADVFLAGFEITRRADAAVAALALAVANLLLAPMLERRDDERRERRER